MLPLIGKCFIHRHFHNIVIRHLPLKNSHLYLQCNASHEGKRGLDIVTLLIRNKQQNEQRIPTVQFKSKTLWTAWFKSNWEGRYIMMKFRKRAFIYGNWSSLSGMDKNAKINKITRWNFHLYFYQFESYLIKKQNETKPFLENEWCSAVKTDKSSQKR